jgi:lysophospholipase L1-like esterase
MSFHRGSRHHVESRGRLFVTHVKRALTCLVLLLICAHASVGETKANTKFSQGWVATWAASPQQPLAFGPAQLPGPFKAQTIRQIARLSVGGNQIRLRFSNESGTQPLVIGSASVAISDGDSKVQAGTNRPITFGGKSTITIPAGAPALSDAIDFAVPALTSIAISIYLPNETPASTVHAAAMDTAYISATGDFTAAPSMPIDNKASMRFFLSGVDVHNSQAPRVIVAFGDSITDGVGSKAGANNRWPDLLAARLLSAKNAKPIAIVNHGISGNQLVRDGMGQGALRRFDRDVLATSGATHVIVLIGINDIGLAGLKMGDQYMVSPADAANAEDMISAYQQLIARAHARGLKIIGATLTPFVGANNGYYTSEKEVQRKAVNEWIRSSKQFDAIIDFDAALRDPKQPAQLLPEYDSGDHLHPSDAGYRKMAQSVELKVFE